MYMHQSRKPEEINVIIKKYYKDTAYIVIDPYKEEVKNILKKASGCKGWVPTDKHWRFDIFRTPELYYAMCEFSEKTGIPINLQGFDEVENYVKTLEEKKKIDNPTIDDYKENEEFYLSLDEFNVENKKSSAKDSSVEKSAANLSSIETGQKNSETTTSITTPILSDENCVYRHICTCCSGHCVDYRCVSEAFLNKMFSKEVLLRENNTPDLYAPNTLWYGKSKTASGIGHFEGNPKGYFVVKKGSRIAENRTAKLPLYVVNKREQLKKEGYVDENNIFTHDFPFLSPGIATAVMTGSTPYWDTFWKAENGEDFTAGDKLDHYSPTFASAKLNGYEVIGMPIVVRDTETKKPVLKFKLLEGNVLQLSPKNNLSQKHKTILHELKGLLNKDDQLKADFVFDSAESAAKILTGNKNADASFWSVAENLSLKDTQELHKMDKYEGKNVYHLEKPTLGTCAALYVRTNDKRKNEYVLLKGSMVTPFLFKSSPGSTRRLFREMHNNRDIVNGVVTRDVTFTSPSAPANICTGSSMNGREEWKTLNGKPLKAEKRSVKKPRI